MHHYIYTYIGLVFSLAYKIRLSSVVYPVFIKYYIDYIKEKRESISLEQTLVYATYKM